LIKSRTDKKVFANFKNKKERKKSERKRSIFNGAESNCGF
jgi:hypothetical protein